MDSNLVPENWNKQGGPRPVSLQYFIDPDEYVSRSVRIEMN